MKSNSKEQASRRTPGRGCATPDLYVAHSTWEAQDRGRACCPSIISQGVCVQRSYGRLGNTYHTSTFARSHRGGCGAGPVLQRASEGACFQCSMPCVLASYQRCGGTWNS